MSVQELFLSYQSFTSAEGSRKQKWYVPKFFTNLVIWGIFSTLWRHCLFALQSLFSNPTAAKKYGSSKLDKFSTRIDPNSVRPKLRPSSKARAWRLGLNYKPALNQSTVYHHLSPKLASCFESPTKLDSGRNVISCYFLGPKISN